MATPFFTKQATQINIDVQSPGSVFIPTLDAAGAPINVSAGFTVQSMVTAPSGNANIVGPGTDPSASMTKVFSTTGVTLSWTEAQANTIAGLMQAAASQYALVLTNDAGTTKSLLSLGLLLVNQSVAVNL